VAPLGLGWPNIVSVSRVVLVPVVVALILVQTKAAAYAATAVFVAGGLTDLLDGYLARRFGSTTLTGAWLDPLTDKLLIAATVIALTAIGRFPVWAAVIIIVREVSVTVLRMYLGRHGTSMPASRIAKWKTASQVTAIGLYILPLSGAEALKLAVLSIAVAITVISGADYFVAAWKAR
jgi:CDP-diacylglycerol---glycerol-3-phosphate 3-phosphatidyltransferase